MTLTKSPWGNLRAEPKPRPVAWRIDAGPNAGRYRARHETCDAYGIWTGTYTSSETFATEAEALRAAKDTTP